MGHVINLLNSPIIGKKSPFSFVPLLVRLDITLLLLNFERSLLKAGVSIDVIAEITGFSVDYIEKIQEKKF